MKEKSKGKGKGWREPADPTCIGKDGKTKARKHHEVALKKEAGEALNKPMERKAEKEIHITVNPNWLIKLQKFCDERGIGFRVDELFDPREGAAVYLRVPETHSAALHDYLNKNEIVEGVFEDDTTNKDLASKELGEEAVVFQHEKPIPQALMTKFCKEFNTELNEDENREKISTKRKDAGSLQEFMSEHGIELEEIEDREMEKVHLSTAEQVVAEVQRQRKESAKAKDTSKTAKKVGEKENAEDLVDWVKNPAKSDLAGIDTAEERHTG